MSENEKKDQINKEVNVIEIYSNSVNFQLSIYDLTMYFGISEPGTDMRKNLANIVMSLQHAKVMSILLEKNIKKYEKEIGAINLPEELLKKLAMEE